MTSWQMDDKVMDGDFVDSFAVMTEDEVSDETLRTNTSLVLSSGEEDDESTLPVVFQSKLEKGTLGCGGIGAGPGAHVSQDLEKIVNRIDQISKLRAVDDKCFDILDNGTVFKHTQDVIVRHKVAENATSNIPSATQSLVDMDRDEVSLSNLVPHGIPFFVGTIDFIDTVSLPDVISVNRLAKTPSETPVFEQCLPKITFWLLEISCLSRDRLTRQTAFSLLMQILQQNQGLHHCSCDTYVSDILLKLGAKKKHFVTFTTHEEITEMIHSEEEVEVLQSAVITITSFLKIMWQSHSLCVIRQHVLMLLNMALDNNVCKVKAHIWSCLEVLLSKATDGDIAVLQEVFCCGVTSYWSNGNHGNCVSLLRLLPETTSKLHILKRQILKQFLLAVIKSSEKDVPDHELSCSVVQHYIQQGNDDINYFQFHSVMSILGSFVKHPEMNWQLSKNKSLFLDKLSHLTAKRIKENVNQIDEQGPVKDFIIRLKLDLEQETGMSSTQTNLFDYFMELQD